MDELLGPLVLFAVAMTLTPGPNVVLVTASAANFGFRRTVPQMLGITFGFGSMVMATGLGFAAGMLSAACLGSVMIWAGFGSVIGRHLADLRARLVFNLSMAGLLVLSLIPVSW
jgi:threonine/homoserine/homoserine lactone efflux protein